MSLTDREAEANLALWKVDRAFAELLGITEQEVVKFEKSQFMLDANTILTGSFTSIGSITVTAGRGYFRGTTNSTGLK